MGFRQCVTLLVLVYRVLLAEVELLHPTKETTDKVTDSIRQLIENHPSDKEGTDLPLIGGFVRLAFHDCVGNEGGDGCISHTVPDNAGLLVYSSLLDELYDKIHLDLISMFWLPL